MQKPTKIICIHMWTTLIPNNLKPLFCPMIAGHLSEEGSSNLLVYY